PPEEVCQISRRSVSLISRCAPDPRPRPRLPRAYPGEVPEPKPPHGTRVAASPAGPRARGGRSRRWLPGKPRRWDSACRWCGWRGRGREGAPRLPGGEVERAAPAAWTSTGRRQRPGGRASARGSRRRPLPFASSPPQHLDDLHDRGPEGHHEEGGEDEEDQGEDHLDGGLRGGFLGLLTALFPEGVGLHP